MLNIGRKFMGSRLEALLKQIGRWLARRRNRKKQQDSRLEASSGKGLGKGGRLVRWISLVILPHLGLMSAFFQKNIN